VNSAVAQMAEGSSQLVVPDLENREDGLSLQEIEHRDFFVSATNRKQALAALLAQLPTANLESRQKSALIMASRIDGVNPVELYKIMCSRLNLCDAASCKDPVEQAMLYDPIARKSVAMAVGLASVGNIYPNIMDKATSNRIAGEYGVFPVSFALRYRTPGSKLNVSGPTRSAIQAHGMFGIQNWARHVYPLAASWVAFLEPSSTPYGLVVVKPLFEIVADAWKFWLKEAAYVAE
jgi:hypothetical protein